MAVLSAVPRSWAAFDDTGFSARSLGLGSAMTAVTDDPVAMIFNPATAGTLRSVGLASNYARQFHIPAGAVDQSQVNAALGIPIRQEIINGGLGLTWIYTDQERYSIDRTIGFIYGTRGMYEFEDGSLEMGGTLKFLTRNFVSGGGATKGSFDLGLLARFREKYAVGLSLLNFNGPSYKSDRVPVTLKVGFSENVGSFTLAFDVSKRESSGFHAGSTSVGTGLEHWWATPRAGSFAARVGLNLGDQDKTLNWGMGWRILGGQLDYALIFPMTGRPRFGHALSALFRFGRSDPEGEYERLLRSELGRRKELSTALEAEEVRQWQLGDEIRLLREELETLRKDLSDKTTSESSTRRKLKEIEDRHQKAAEAHRKLKEEERRRAERTPETLFREDWTGYQRMKTAGASEAVLLDQVKRLLRQYKDSGVDLSEVHLELKRLLR